MDMETVICGNSLALPDSHLEVRRVLQDQEALVGLAMDHMRCLALLGALGGPLIQDLPFGLYNQGLPLGLVLLWRQGLLSGGLVLWLCLTAHSQTHKHPH